MDDAEIRELVTSAEEVGYTFTVRHQPAVDHEEPDWIVIAVTPEGRKLFPAAVESVEGRAWVRAATRVRQDLERRAASSA